MEYRARRNHLFRRLRLQLAEPVANLLVTAYEPRVETDESSNAFNKLLAGKKKELREAISNLTTRDGGKVEKMASTVTRELILEAEKSGLMGAVEQLNRALERCAQIKPAAEVREPMPAERLPDMARVIGQSGKPIGLWR